MDLPPSWMDWVPFGCLVTGNITKKPLVVALLEKLVIGVVAGIVAFIGSMRVLETDVILLQREVREIQSQRGERRKQLDQDRNDLISAMRRMEERFDRLEDCIRVRTCTK